MVQGEGEGLGGSGGRGDGAPCARADDVLPTSPDGASRGLGLLGKLHFIKIRGFCAFQGHMGCIWVPVPYGVGTQKHPFRARSHDHLSDSSCPVLGEPMVLVEDLWPHWEATARPVLATP